MEHFFLFGSQLRLYAGNNNRCFASSLKPFIKTFSLQSVVSGYVAATDLSVLAQQQAVLARELYIKHRFSAQRQNAIKIAKEFKVTPGNSETVQHLLEQTGKVSC